MPSLLALLFTDFPPFNHPIKENGANKILETSFRDIFSDLYKKRLYRNNSRSKMDSQKKRNDSSSTTTTTTWTHYLRLRPFPFRSETHPYKSFYDRKLTPRGREVYTMGTLRNLGTRHVIKHVVSSRSHFPLSNLPPLFLANLPRFYRPDRNLSKSHHKRGDNCTCNTVLHRYQPEGSECYLNLGGKRRRRRRKGGGRKARRQGGVYELEHSIRKREVSVKFAEENESVWRECVVSTPRYFYDE